ncbi:MAG: DUF5919 domain-containing protein [Anaerolineae bacterium]|jgi:hypothetical protein
MKRWERFRQLWGQPAYRIKLAFFLILSIAIFLASFLITSTVWSDILLQFAVTFGAVGVLQLLWDFLGGEPLEIRIDEVKHEVRDIKSSVDLLSDLLDGNIGLERIWPDRRSWQEDPQDGLSIWQERVCQADQADIVSNTLWINWMQEKHRKQLFKQIARGARVRMLIYEPGSEVQRLRAKDEQDVPGQMESEIKATLVRLAQDRKTLPESARKNLEVRLTNYSVHPAQIIRADDRTIVATYLAGKGGSPSPTMQLRGTETAYFQKYVDQVEILWERAKPVDDEAFDRMLGEYGVIPTPPEVD